MLKTNSKKARENIRAYILNHYNPCGYDLPEVTTFSGVAGNILEVFHEEKRYEFSRRCNEQEIFDDYTRGLPDILDTCYWYNRSAVEDLGNILEETKEERERYSEEKAGTLLTYLIYRELVKAAK